MYSEDRRVWNAMYEIVAKDLRDAQQNGVRMDDGEVIYPIVLGNKGDWSYLVPWLFTLIWNYLVFENGFEHTQGFQFHQIFKSTYRIFNTWLIYI